MPRYVNVDNLEVSNYVTVWDCNCSEFGKQTVVSVDDLQYLPTADVVEVVHSEWHTDAVRMNSVIATCRNCHRTEEIHITNCFEYCPHCGAKMDGKED